MCYPVTCQKCHKTGWGGCGEHIDAVMSSVAVTDRCSCRAEAAPLRQEHRAVQSFLRR